MQVGANHEVDRADLLARVATLSPLLESTASASEAAGSMIPEAVEALRDAGLFRLWSPREVGGYDISAPDQLEILVAVARIDMSACWTLMIGNSGSAVMASRLPDEGVGRLFGDSAWPTAASSLAPSGRARRCEGGYRINGRWGFGSGIRHAIGAMTNCLVDDPHDSAPAQISAFVPVEQLDILDDWHVPGLRGTGSNSYAAADVFVPDHFIATLRPLKIHRGGARAAGLPLRLPIEHGAVALGGARRAIDEVTTQAIGKRRLAETRTVADSQSFQVELGRLEAQHASLLAGARAAAADFESALGGPADALADAAAMLRAVCAHATEGCQAIVNRCLRFAGAGAIMPGNPLERLQRDMTVAAQHYVVADSAYEGLGQRRLGLTP
ncbi:MAG: acyl-CoA dehydrogenase family protein [Alphaproteobacteria bacterium]